MIKKPSLIPILLMTLVFACSKDKALNPDLFKSKTYLHLSHTRSINLGAMDSIAQSIAKRNFDMLWLGGDLAASSSDSDSTMERLDSLYDLGNAATLWTLGNHDYSDLGRVSQYTKRPSYYASSSAGITLIVLDSQDSLSHIKGNQKDFLFNILDTISRSSHLIILHHKLMWMYGNPELEPKIKETSNGELGSCYYCLNPNNFNAEIYPKLLRVQKRGIQVICLGGDLGVRAKEFEYQSKEGMYFLASGLGDSHLDSKALLFHHNVLYQQLSWEFIPVNDL